MKDIVVHNLKDEPKTKAKILIQNKTEYVPKISVIIPVYNTAPYLRQCLDSVVNQSLNDIEIICVDDGSTDNSLSILKEYAQKDNRFTIIAQKNLYAGVARNAGLSVAKGEYIHFLDSDDWIDRDTYSKLYSLIKERNVEVLKFRSYTYDDENSTIVNSPYTDISSLSEQNFDVSYNLETDYKILTILPYSPLSGIYDRNFLVQNHIYFDNLLCVNDVSFFFRCLVHAKRINLTKQRFVYYRVGRKTSLIGIRAYHFDCQIQQFFNLEKIIRNCSQQVQNFIKKRAIYAVFMRYCQYYASQEIPTDIKIKLQSEMQPFLSHISTQDVPTKYLKYFKTQRTISYKLFGFIPLLSIEEK